MKIGDVVRVRSPIDTNSQSLRGLIGTVKVVDMQSLSDDNREIGIDFGRNVGGSNINGLTPEGHGYWIKSRDLQIMKPVKEMFPTYWENEWKDKLKPKTENRLSIILLEEGKNNDENFRSKQRSTVCQKSCSKVK